MVVVCPAARNFSSGAREAPQVTPGTGSKADAEPSRSLTCSGPPRLRRRQCEPGALGSTWQPGAASLRAVPGSPASFWGGVPAEISAARLRGRVVVVVVVVSPGTSDPCGPGLAVRRAPRPGCARATPQVSARAALEVSSRAFWGEPPFPARAARGPPGDGTSEALALPTRRPLGHLPTCWSFAK